MEHALISFVFGLVGGLVGGLVSSRFLSGGRILPSLSSPLETVERRGPSQYVVASPKRKPKAKTDRELWEIENRENVKD